MIQTPILDSAVSPTRDLKGVGPYNNVPSQKPHPASSNLRDHLENQRTSQILSAVDMFIGDEGAQDIANFLNQNKHYTSIHLRGNNISSAGFEAICNSLQGSNNLKEIAAEWNNIGSDAYGVAALHKFVQTSNSLETIDLKNNRLNAACAPSIANIIRHSNSLKKMDLRWNELGAEGGQQILNALEESGKRVKLDLNGNRIPEQILVQIGQFSTGRGSPAQKSTTVDQGGKRMFQSQISQPTYTQAAPVSTANYQLGGTIPSKYSNMTTNDGNNVNTHGATQKKAYEVPSERNSLYSSAIQVPSQRVDPGLRVDTGANLKKSTFGQDVGERVDTFGSLSQFEHHPPQQFTYTHVHPHEQVHQVQQVQQVHQVHFHPPEQVHVPVNAFISPHRHPEMIAHEVRPVYEVKQEIVRVPPVRTIIPQPVIEERFSIERPHAHGHVLTPVHVMPEIVPVAEVRHHPVVRQAPVVHEHAPVQRGVSDDGNLKVGKLISDLERAADTERERAIDLQARLDSALRDLEIHAKARQDAEKKHSHILDELRRRDVEVNELRVKVDTLSEQNTKLSHQIEIVQEENARIDEYNKAGMAEIEQRYRLDLDNYQAENQMLKKQLESIQQNSSNQITHLRKDFEERCRHYEDQIAEFTRLNDELSNELTGQLDFIERIKFEHEETLRRTVMEVREEGIKKAEPVIRGLEEEVNMLQENNRQLTAKNSEMLFDLQAYEKQIRDLHMQFATELNRVGNDMDKIRAELNQASLNVQRLTNDLTVRNNTIMSLEGENERLRQELQRQANEYHMQMENLRRDLDAERRRLSDQEVQIHHKVEELERRLLDAHNENVRITVEYDQLVQMIQGNVNRVIHDAFITHKSTSEVRHVGHMGQSVVNPVTPVHPVRTVVETPTPIRGIFEEKPALAQSRIFTTADRRYL